MPRTRKTDIGVKGNQDLLRCAYPSAFYPLARNRALTFYAHVMLGDTRIIERRAGNVLGVATPERLSKYIYVTLQELLKSYRSEILVLEEAKNMKGFLSMSELVTVKSMVELRNKLGVLPTLVGVRLSPWQAAVLCEDALGNLPEDMQHKLQQAFDIPEEAKHGDEGLSSVGVTAYGNAIRFMRMMHYKRAEVISSGYDFDDSVRAVIAPYGKSWVSPKESYFTLHQLRTWLNPIEWRSPKVREFVGRVEHAFPQEATLTEAWAVAPTEYVIKTLTVYRKALKWLMLAKESPQLQDSLDERERLIKCLELLKEKIMEGVLPIE